MVSRSTSGLDTQNWKEIYLSAGLSILTDYADPESEVTMWKFSRWLEAGYNAPDR